MLHTWVFGWFDLNMIFILILLPLLAVAMIQKSCQINPITVGFRMFHNAELRLNKNKNNELETKFKSKANN